MVKISIRKITFLTISILYAFATSNAYAEGSRSAEIQITGMVPDETSLEVGSSASGFSIMGAQNEIQDLSAGATKKVVGTISEKSRNRNGYTVSMVGVNSGNHTGLFVDEDSGAKLPFTVFYDGVEVTDTVVINSNKRAKRAIEREISISFEADSSLPSSNGYSYKETLQFTISAK